LAYNLIAAETSPALRKLYLAIFPPEQFELYLASNLEEVSQLLETINSEALILSSNLLESTEALAQLQARLTADSRMPVFLVTGSFEPSGGNYLDWLKPEKVFIKPFYSENLAQAVREAIEKRRIPDTLPEELPEAPGTQTPTSNAFLSPALVREVRLLIQQEVLEAERELEKRLRSSLLNEFKKNNTNENIEAEKEKNEQGRKKG
jgi:DNA-binding NtrC family response regulator